MTRAGRQRKSMWMGHADKGTKENLAQKGKKETKQAHKNGYLWEAQTEKKTQTQLPEGMVLIKLIISSSNLHDSEH